MAASISFIRTSIFIVLAALYLVGCSDVPQPMGPPPKHVEDPSDSALDTELSGIIEQSGLTGDPAADLPPVATPDEDPKIKLGQMLFFSRALSLDYDTACATCHHPRLGSGDDLSLNVGVSAKYPNVLGLHRTVSVDRSPFSDGGPDGPRNSQPIYNAVLNQKTMFWDGRVYSVGTDADGVMQIRTPESGKHQDPNAGGNLLQAQSRFPINTPVEMRGFNHPELNTGTDVRRYLVARFRGVKDPARHYDPADDPRMTTKDRANWLQMFKDAFGDADKFTLITFTHIQEAIAAYESQWIYVNTPWNAYVQGDKSAISEEAKKGASLFFTSIQDGGLGCASCHAGDRFTDEDFYNVAFPQFGHGKRANRNDLGRYAVIVSPDNKYAYRTPSLLNIMDTGPWGHVGSFETMKSLLQYHVNPTAYVPKYTLANVLQLKQFRISPLTAIGHTAYQSTLNTMHAAINAVSFTDIAKGKLPNRSLSTPEIDQLTAFLHSLSDPAVTQFARNGTCNDKNASPCPAIWVPQRQDPRTDNNTLFAWFDSAIPPNPERNEDEQHGDDEDHGVNYPDAIAMNLSYNPLKSDFADAQNCIMTSHPFVPNSGTLSFTENATDIGLGAAVHGFTAETWFQQNGLRIDMIMQSGGLSAAYLNDDCWPDLVFSGGDTSGILTFINNGDTSGFTQDMIIDTSDINPNHTGDILSVDLNGDYQRELIIGNILPGSVAILQWNDKDEQYKLASSLPMGRNTYGISAGDINNDSYPDLLLAHWSGGGLPGSAPILFVNDSGTKAVPADSDWGIGTADGMSQTFNFTPALADLNGDGKQDLLVASDFLTSWMSHNNGERFVNDDPLHKTLIDTNGMGQTLGDFNNDGLLDWFVSSIYDPMKYSLHPGGTWGIIGNQLYQNITPQEDNARIQFTNVTDNAGVADAGWGWGGCAADFNNDGWLDLFVENGWGFIPALAGDTHDTKASYEKLAGGLFNTTPKLFINNGDGTFSDRSDEMGFKKSNGRGVVCFDYDHDGDIDIAVNNNSGQMLFYTNMLGHDADHFLNIRLVGNSSNTDALGAIVKVTATIDDRTITQTREVNQNSHFVSHNLTNLHYGLGNANDADVEITWPDGTVDQYSESANGFVVYQQ